MHSDEALLELARTLNVQLGRPPKADELIDVAGGCQRKRALAAIQSLRLDLSQRNVRSQLLFAPAIESQLRSLMAAWLDLAAQHLSQRHAEFGEEAERRQDAMLSQIEELQERVEASRRAEEDRDQERDSLERLINQLTVDRDRARSERDAVQAVAEDRRALVERLLMRMTPAEAGAGDSR